MNCKNKSLKNGKLSKANWIIIVARDEDVK